MLLKWKETKSKAIGTCAGLNTVPATRRFFISRRDYKKSQKLLLISGTFTSIIGAGKGSNPRRKKKPELQ